MARVFLQDMAASIPLEALPAHWTAFDLAAFSRSKMLYDYQQRAVESAIKVLWKYYEDFRDYQPHEGEDAVRERKRKFHAWYRDNGHEKSLDIPPPGTSSRRPPTSTSRSSSGRATANTSPS